MTPHNKTPGGPDPQQARLNPAAPAVPRRLPTEEHIEDAVGQQVELRIEHDSELARLITQHGNTTATICEIEIGKAAQDWQLPPSEFLDYVTAILENRRKERNEAIAIGHIKERKDGAPREE